MKWSSMFCRITQITLTIVCSVGLFVVSIPIVQAAQNGSDIRARLLCVRETYARLQGIERQAAVEKQQQAADDAAAWQQAQMAYRATLNNAWDAYQEKLKDALKVWSVTKRQCGPTLTTTDERKSCEEAARQALERAKQTAADGRQQALSLPKQAWDKAREVYLAAQKKRLEDEKSRLKSPWQIVVRANAECH